MKAIARPIPARLSGSDGFTLIEALAAVAMTGFILMSLATITGQWLPQWRVGFGRVQRLQQLDVGLRRIIADIDAAEFVTPNNQTRALLFIGDAASVTLVRVAASPGVAPRLEVVRLAPDRDARGAALVRTRAPFAPFRPEGSIADQVSFGDPIALVRAPLVVSFAYAGPDGVWRDSWTNSVTLPSVVRVRVRDSKTGGQLAASTAAHPLVEAPAACIGRKALQKCIAGLDAEPPDSGAANSAEK